MVIINCFSELYRSWCKSKSYLIKKKVKVSLTTTNHNQSVLAYSLHKERKEEL